MVMGWWTLYLYIMCLMLRDEYLVTRKCESKCIRKAILLYLMASSFGTLKLCGGKFLRKCRKQKLLVFKFKQSFAVWQQSLWRADELFKQPRWQHHGRQGVELLANRAALPVHLRCPTYTIYLMLCRCGYEVNRGFILFLSRLQLLWVDGRLCPFVLFWCLLASQSPSEVVYVSSFWFPLYRITKILLQVRQPHGNHTRLVVGCRRRNRCRLDLCHTSLNY